MKMLFPKTDATAMTGIFLNTAGGITGGDHLNIRARAKDNSHLRLSTQAAERVYRAQPSEVGRVDTSLSAGPGARLDWLPQETILFDQSALHRRQEVRLYEDARLLMVEPLVLGRAAMGEVIEHTDLRDQIRIYRDDQLIFTDTLRLKGDVDAHMRGTAIGNGAGAMASVVLATSPDEADQMLARIREQLPLTAGASVVHPGLLFIRFLAGDSFDLRKTLIPVLTCLNEDPLPRTWMI
ncbi:MAG: urease accessory protein UreD [Thalassovita sp.]